MALHVVPVDFIANRGEPTQVDVGHAHPSSRLVVMAATTVYPQRAVGPTAIIRKCKNPLPLAANAFLIRHASEQFGTRFAARFVQQLMRFGAALYGTWFHSARTIANQMPGKLFQLGGNQGDQQRRIA